MGEEAVDLTKWPLAAGEVTGYVGFLRRKEGRGVDYGFAPSWVPPFLFPFQRHLVEWAVAKGRAALFESCGLGKTPQQLVWAENVVHHTNKRVLILTPLAVSSQTVREGAKFGVEVHKTQEGTSRPGINVTNYERLQHFNPSDFAGVVCDESSIIKNQDGRTRQAVTDFVGKVPYRLLCTATPAPNDHMELGSSSEALGAMTRSQMLGMFFTNTGESTSQWELKGHARKKFWRWLATWARAVQKPSDLGYEDGGFDLPPLEVCTHYLPSERGRGGFGLFPKMAVGLAEQRDEKRASLRERCEKVAAVLPPTGPAVVWCHLNSEGDLLTRLIPGAVQVAGKDLDEVKEERLEAFANGQIRVLVTKPKIASFGLNWQHCNTVAYFPSHSHEQWYQAIRRCWRFGQGKPVTCHVVLTEAEKLVLDNMMRKERQAQELYQGIIQNMLAVAGPPPAVNGSQTLELPPWLLK